MKSPSSYRQALELAVLQAVAALKDDAYSVTVHKHVCESWRSTSSWAVRQVLVRLEVRGWLASHMGEPDHVSGGRSKRLYSVEKKGLAVLKDKGSK